MDQLNRICDEVYCELRANPEFKAKWEHIRNEARQLGRIVAPVVLRRLPDVLMLLPALVAAMADPKQQS